MPTSTSECGSLALPIGQYHVAIDTVQTITMPTTAQRTPIISPTSFTKMGGLMAMYLSVDTQSARFTLDGTNPTALNGILLAVSTTTVFRGENQIKALKIIGIVAGGFINYCFTVDEIG